MTYVLVTYIVSNESERLHPMDSFVVRVDIDAEGIPTTESMTRLGERIAHSVVGKVSATKRREAFRLAEKDPGDVTREGP